MADTENAQATDQEAKPETASTDMSVKSGGIDVQAEQASAGADMVGRDKIVQEEHVGGDKIVAQNVYIISVPDTPQIAPSISKPSSGIATPQAIEPEISRTPIPFDWVTIPAGEFLMGSNNQQDQDAEFIELPQHRVSLPEYRIARVPVTVGQFRHFVNAMNYTTTAERQGWAYDWTDTNWVPIKDAYWRHPHGPNSDVQDDDPVTCMSWDDAIAFCEWARVRLPTEAEWEKAASWDEANKAKRKWPWGNTFDSHKCNSHEANIGGTTPVGKYSPHGDSAYGVADMAGNVCEWCEDWYDANYYKYSPSRNPQGPASGEYRVVRGGTWFQKRTYVRCAHRHSHVPNATVSDFGFRVCAMKRSE